MQSNNLTVPLFLFGAALTVAVCGITIAGWKHRLLVWGLLALASALALLAIFWGIVSTEIPVLASVITSVASAQIIWFLAIIAALISTISSNLKVKRLLSSSSSDLAVIDRELKAYRALENRLEKLEQGATPEIAEKLNSFATHADVHRLDEQFSDVREKQKFATDLARGAVDQVDNLGNLLGLRIKQTQDGVDTLLRGVRERFDNVDGAFLAISHLEWARRLGAELEEKAAVLLKQADEIDSEAKWSFWEDAENNWRGELDQLLMVAEGYAPGTTDKVRSTAEYENAQWEPHNPTFNGAQVRRFQNFVIFVENLKKHRQKVESAIYRRAYLRPSMKGQDVEIGPATD